MRLPQQALFTPSDGKESRRGTKEPWTTTRGTVPPAPDTMISVLYVDDETGLLELGKVFLEDQGGIQVDTAPSAQKALDLIAGHRYDAVVSDFQMPDMDGIEFLRYIRTHAGNLPVILFTGKGREDVVIDAINNGADYYIQKGGEPEAKFAELREKINLAVERIRSEEKVHHFNRLYAIMSGINAVVLHVRTRDELFKKVCTIIREDGRFPRAWIGLVDRERTAVYPAACCGFGNESIAAVPVSAGAGVTPQSLSGRVVFSRKRAVIRDLPRTAAVSAKDADDPHPVFESTAAFPIWLHNTIIGTIQIYAGESAFFQDDEIQFIDQICTDISFALETLEADEQREKAERALAESEEKFRILVEESLMGVYILRDDHFIHVNPKFAEISGYSQDELLNNLTLDDLLTPESRKLVSFNIEKRLAGESKSLHYTFQGKRKDGTIIDLEAAGTRAEYKGEPIIIGTIVDITERKIAETERAQKIEELSLANKKIRAAEERLWAHIAALTESQERLNEHERRMMDIINFLPDATFVIDTAGSVLVWNRAMERMTGIPASAMLGKDNYEYALPFYNERRPVLADLVLHDSDPVATMYEFLQKDGEKLTAKVFLANFMGRGGVYLWFTAAPIYDTRGTIAGAIETIRDITEVEEARLALKTSTERYQSLIHNAQEGVLVFRDGKVAYSNEGIRAILGGYSEEELRGRQIGDLFDHTDISRIPLLSEHRTPGMPWHEPEEIRISSKDGTIRILESRAVAIDWEGGPATLCFLSPVPGTANDGRTRSMVS